MVQVKTSTKPAATNGINTGSPMRRQNWRRLAEDVCAASHHCSRSMPIAGTRRSTSRGTLEYCIVITMAANESRGGGSKAGPALLISSVIIPKVPSVTT